MWNLLPGTVFRGCEPVFGQSGRLDHILGRDVERPGIFFRFRLFLRRPSHKFGHAFTVTKNRWPVLCALSLEAEDVGFVVTDILEQFVPGGPFVVRTPASQGFQADLPAGGKLPFSYHRVVHLLLQD